MFVTVHRADGTAIRIQTNKLLAYGALPKIEADGRRTWLRMTEPVGGVAADHGSRDGLRVALHIVEPVTMLDAVLDARPLTEVAR